MFWFVFAAVWVLLGVVDLVASWVTGQPRQVPDALLYAMVSMTLAYVTEDRKEKR